MITVIFRTVILYFFLTLGVRLMGKRQIGDMQPNELVITFLISEIATVPLQDPTQPIMFGVMAIFILVVLEITVSVLAMKFRKVRKLMSGKSVIVIKDGEIDRAALKKVRMTLLDLIELLRQQKVFDISTVAFAVVEVNGDLSILLKAPYETVTLKDLKIKSEKTVLPLPVIIDGKIEEDSLEALDMTKSELDKILKQNKTSLERVFLMTADKDKNYDITEMREGV